MNSILLNFVWDEQQKKCNFSNSLRNSWRGIMGYQNDQNETDPLLEMKKKIEKQENMIKLQKQDNDELIKIINNLEQQIQIQKQKEKNIIDESKNKIDYLSLQIVNLNKQRETFIKDKFNSLNCSDSVNLDVLTQQIIHLQQFVPNEYKDQFEELNGSYKQLLLCHQELDRQTNTVDNEKQQLIDDYQETVISQDKKIKKQQQQHNDYIETINEQGQKILKQQQEKKDYIETISEQHSKIQDMNETFRKFGEKFRMQEEIITLYKAKLLEFNSQIQSLQGLPINQEYIQVLLESSNKLEQKVQYYEKQIQQLKEELAYQKQKNMELMNQVKQDQEAFQEKEKITEASLKSMQEEITNLEDANKKTEENFMHRRNKESLLANIKWVELINLQNIISTFRKTKQEKLKTQIIEIDSFLNEINESLQLTSCDIKGKEMLKQFLDRNQIQVDSVLRNSNKMSMFLKIFCRRKINRS